MPCEQPGLRVVVEADPGAFVERAGGFLAGYPVEHSVLLTRSAQAVTGALPAADEGDLWLWVEQPDGAVLCAAMQTPPHGLYLSLGPPVAVRALAGALWQVRPHLPGVGGMLPGPETFASRWLALGGPAAETGMRQGVYAAHGVRHPIGVPGRHRLASGDDAPLLRSWAQAFTDETGTGIGSAVDHVGPRLAAGLLHVWEDDAGQPVSMAAVTGAFAGVSRVQLVYTPPDERGRGYASACVAAVTGRELEHTGRSCMLFTDLADPTSNAIYQQVGYEWVGEARTLVFAASPRGR